MNYSEMYVEGALPKIEADIAENGQCVLYSKMTLNEETTTAISGLLLEKGFNTEVTIEDDPDFIGSRYKLLITRVA
ncbi:TPA: hypothetical protein JI034_10200 [Acinetobacter baumannii]|uniref:hypothetical protein n=1 Tax=Acinetobacter baumannii TaxID=470 RepID=UPI0007EB386C|nr:hypothetical protein [Acinetobacter baumannii]SBS21286.1 Uncharacterised protein [Acinetobacter baumannii]HAV2932490.1 hypothetical protein [Acinetobacter baumannii]HAV3087480.1 hypothetical protein [Acinetobacter baumannii]HAV4615509.1 hypothetical protein [Acinetobacter baumannii]HAV4622397.1 hypothetical protein [Acinetobacter baumannii]